MAVTMHNWFQTQVKYQKIGTDDGKQKTVTDTYLVDALSFTEAEARTIEHARPYMTGEFSVSSAKRSRVYEIFESPSGDKWYRAKVLFVVLDQEKGIEKKIPSTMVIQADTVKEALQTLEEGMKGTMSDWELYSITETPILDVLPYKAPEASEEDGGAVPGDPE